jgi:spore coat protein A, manganese oxidase
MLDRRFTRRALLKAGALAGATLAIPGGWLAGAPPAAAFSQTDRLRKFIQPLRGVGGTGIPLAQPDPLTQPWWQPGVTHYTIDIRQFADQLHPDLPNPTRLWGFGQGSAAHFRHLGGIIAVKRGTPVQITFRNHLPARHILPVDRSIMGTENQDNRSDVHLHGGFVPWTSDGGPHAWWDPQGHHGPSFLNNDVLRRGASVPANEAEYYYPNQQGSRLVWYHDHSIGTTRLNAYAGIASAYVIYDDYELGLVAVNHLPGPLDPRTVYLVFQDKIFVSERIERRDPTWPAIMPHSRPGDLWYAHVYDPDRWDLAPEQPAGPPPNPSVVPEFFGDTILVNGTAYPFLEVEQRQYRFRLLNACQARFLNPRLVFAKGLDHKEPGSFAGPAFVQIGTEGGFLPTPVYLDGSSLAAVSGSGPSQLLLAPAERADLIVDFRDIPAGSRLILVSDADAPYPDGDGINDYHPGNPETPSSRPGFGPNTRTLLQIRVKARVGAANPPIRLPQTLQPTDPFVIAQSPGVPTANPADAAVRRLTLNEASDEHGRLIQFLGTDTPLTGSPGFGEAYLDKPTEVVKAGTEEVWEIANLTGDTHPIHFHLVNVQVLSRQEFDMDHYAGGAPTFTGPAVAPDNNELGWKETVRMNPGEVTRVWMRFDLPVVPFTVPVSPRLAEQYGIHGAEYVWHCHILDHEEHDMMRPLVIV